MNVENMRVVFLCGSLELGRDGVGDYVRRLAVSLADQGCEVAAISLNDKHCTELYEGTQEEEGKKLNVVRIPASWTEKHRFQYAKKCIDEFSPSWISLQFVPYSFHPKGIPSKLGKYLSTLKSPGRKWHIMFHELWIGTGSLKETLISIYQRLIIIRILNTLKPAAINVSISLNQHRLKQVGFNSAILNLFGNIPKANLVENDPITQPLQGKKNILYFGGPPRSEFRTQVITGLKDFCSHFTEPVNIVLVSGNSQEKDHFVKILETELSIYQSTIIDLGFLETDQLSNLMTTCSAGIIRSDPRYIGKSGSAISMLEHGLPVWMPKWDGVKTLEYGFRKELIYANLSEAVSSPGQAQYQSLLPGVVQTFISQLNSN
jgi:hypothetical protein